MKERFPKVFSALLTVLCIPIILLICIGFLLYTPLDMLKYRRTHYYKDTREKYTWLATVSHYVKLYDAIKENGLPIVFHRRKDVRINAYGYYIFQDWLIIADHNEIVEEEPGVWKAEIEDVYVKIEEAVNQELHQCNDFLGLPVVARAVVLTDNSSVPRTGLTLCNYCTLLPCDGEDIAVALRHYFDL